MPTTIRLDLALVLPELDPGDACVHQLTAELARVKGIEAAQDTTRCCHLD